MPRDRSSSVEDGLAYHWDMLAGCWRGYTADGRYFSGQTFDDLMQTYRVSNRECERDEQDAAERDYRAEMRAELRS